MTRVHTIAGMTTLLQVYAEKKLVDGLAPDGEWVGRAAIRPGCDFGGAYLLTKVWCKNCKNLMFGHEIWASPAITDLEHITNLLEHAKESFHDNWRVGRHSCKYEAWRKETRPWMDRICTMSPARLPGHPHHEQYVMDMERY